MISVPSRFQPAIDRLMTLQERPGYLGAFIFGSVARGEATDASDLDVKVVTSETNSVFEILHPVIGGVKLDITFESLDQLRAEMGKEKSEKIPRRKLMIAESAILFDKTGELATLKAVCPAHPARHASDEYAHLRFLVHHANDKVARHIASDPDAAMLSMHACLNELLDIHYGVRGHWKVSSKRLLADLESWDTEMASAVRSFLRAPDTLAKFACWREIVERVRAPIGGKLPLDAYEPRSELSKQGLRDLLERSSVAA